MQLYLSKKKENLFDIRGKAEETQSNIFFCFFEIDILLVFNIQLQKCVIKEIWLPSVVLTNFRENSSAKKQRKKSTIKTTQRTNFFVELSTLNF